MITFFKKRIDLNFINKAEEAIARFTIGERAVFYILALIMITSSVFILSKTSDAFSVTIPKKGGELTEGILGSPRFINPILAISDADRDLSSLIFSGLLRPNLDGSLKNDLASKYEISEDGLSYTVTLKDKLFFHDGEPISAEDVLFTVEKAQDPAIKSPRRAEWEGVTVEKIDDKTVVFHLPKPYYPFVENLTLGIIPKHQWKETGPEEFAFSLKNINPIGGGPYFIKNVEKNDKGIPTIYKLSSFKKYKDNAPYIQDLTIKLFSKEEDLIDAWKNKKIDSMGGISSKETLKLKELGAKIERLKLPRIYGIFLNQNQATIFTEKAVRQALDISVNKDEIVEKVLLGYGTSLYGPLPEEIIGNDSSKNTTPTASSTEQIEKARKILEKAGWKINPETNVFEKSEKVKNAKVTKTLSFSLAVPNVEELKEIADLVTKQWKEMGAKVEIKTYELSDLQQSVIRPRKYDALFFGQVIGRNPDLFAFWHSSQRNDPGYNIALYTNSKVDKMLDESRRAHTQEDQEKIIKNIYTEIKNDVPAIFLFAPDYLYLLPQKVNGFEAGYIASPGERFSEIGNWFIDKQKVWQFLIKEPLEIQPEEELVILNTKISTSTNPIATSTKPTKTATSTTNIKKQ
jgi:peptide/nickel transport system substrate-binding protein